MSERAPLNENGHVDVLASEIGMRPPEMSDDDPRAYIAAGKRLAVGVCPWMGDFFVGTSPRNGDGAAVEGPWEDWVALAHRILEAEDWRKAHDGVGWEPHDTEGAP